MKLEALMSRSQPTALEARLRAVAGRIAELVGFSSYIAGHRVDAFNAFAVAEVLGRDAGSGEVVATVLAAKSRLYSRSVQERGDPARAIALLDAAELSTSPAVPPALRSWVHGRRAEEHSDQGDDVASGRDLESAYRVLGSSSDNNLFSSLDSAWLDNYRGARAVKLGRSDEAIRIYEGVLQYTDPQLLWERTLALTQLATAWAQREELEQACWLLAEAAASAAANGYTTGLRLVVRVRDRQLGRWRSEPHVRALDEAIRSARAAL
jgi:tetratricopeptide (TPR) repeat protein